MLLHTDHPHLRSSLVFLAKCLVRIGVWELRAFVQAFTCRGPRSKSRPIITPENPFHLLPFSVLYIVHPASSHEPNTGSAYNLKNRIKQPPLWLLCSRVQRYAHHASAAHYGQSSTVEKMAIHLAQTFLLSTLRLRSLI